MAKLRVLGSFTEVRLVRDRTVAFTNATQIIMSENFRIADELKIVEYEKVNRVTKAGAAPTVCVPDGEALPIFEAPPRGYALGVHARFAVTELVWCEHLHSDIVAS